MSYNLLCEKECDILRRLIYMTQLSTRREILD